MFPTAGYIRAPSSSVSSVHLDLSLSLMTPILATESAAPIVHSPHLIIECLVLSLQSPVSNSHISTLILQFLPQPTHSSTSVSSSLTNQSRFSAIPHLHLHLYPMTSAV